MCPIQSMYSKSNAVYISKNCCLLNNFVNKKNQTRCYVVFTAYNLKNKQIKNTKLKTNQ